MDRKKLITAAALLVGAVVIVIAVMSDDRGITGVSGTMASPDTVTGVQPATRYRAPQITRNDLQLDDPSFVQLLQNESFREIVQSGDMALIAAIEELSRAASLEDVSDLSRTDALAEVPDIIAHEEWGNISALAAEVPIGEVADAAMDGTLSAIAEIVRDEKGFTAFGDLIRENDLIKIVNLAADRPEGEDFSTFDVIKEIFEKDLEDEFQEFVEAIPEDETGPDAPRDDAWIKRKVADGFGRTPVADRVADLYRAGYLGAVRDLYRTGFMERTEALYRAGYLDNAAKMARTEGSLERVDRMLRTEGNLELVARLARTPGALERTVAYAGSDRFQLVASLERVSAAEAVGDLARTGYLERVDRFAKTEGFARMSELAQAGKLWRVAEMANNGDLARTIADY
jgi:hypothetical protein